MESTTTHVELSDIQRFYKGSVVFLTGATGFIGKLYLEKVLRALPVKKVFILVRAKKDVPAAKRFQTIFESPVFDVVKRTNPDALNKVTILEGDCSLPMLGMSERDIETFVREVDVVFHCAATVRFDEELKKATRTNVRATVHLMVLAKRIRKLKTFVYVGTAFSNSNLREIREEFYPAKIRAEDLIAACESLDADSLRDVTKTLIGDWPNTYTFTKQVTEDYINREGKNMPICIARPAIVVSTAAEPMVGFVDNMYTLAGFVMINAMGVSRITYSRNTITDIVPADYVVNGCIAAGWQTGETFKAHRNTNPPIYNISSYQDNPIHQDDIYGLVDYHGRQIPSEQLFGYPLYFRTTCKYNYLFLRFFFHTMVAHIIDFVLRVLGKKPINAAEGIKKLHSFHEAYEHFTINEFFMHVENSHKLLKKMTFKDRELFNFDMCTVDWDTYFVQYVRGLRFYLLKDPMNTVPQGLKRYNYNKKVMIVTLVFATIFLYGLAKIFLFRVVPVVFGLVAYFLRSLVC